MTLDIFITMNQMMYVLICINMILLEVLSR